MAPLKSMLLTLIRLRMKSVYWRSPKQLILSHLQSWFQGMISHGLRCLSRYGCGWRSVWPWWVLYRHWRVCGTNNGVKSGPAHVGTKQCTHLTGPTLDHIQTPVFFLHLCHMQWEVAAHVPIYPTSALPKLLIYLFFFRFLKIIFSPLF